MKRILYLFVMAGLLLTSSCSDELEQSPTTSLPAGEAIQSVEDLQLAFNGVMQMLSVSRGAYASDFTLYADGKGGDVQPIGDNGQFTPVEKYELTKTSVIPDAMYEGFYEAVAYANMALEAGQKLGLTTDEYKSLEGQLIAIRAIVHFDAARTFAQLPTVSGVDMNKANSGIVISNAVYPVSSKFKRSTLQETYNFVITELEKAIPALPTKITAGSVNVWGAKAILARAYLYTGDNAKAYNMATDVINNSGAKLFTSDTYVDSWSKVGAAESLVEVLTSDNISNNPQRNSVGYYTDPNGYAEVGASQPMITFLNSLNDNDIRKQSITQRSSTTGTRTGYYTIKYPGQSGSTTPLYTNNPKLMRLAEVYLIAAEAALKNGDTTNALKYYNGLRASRYSSGYTDATTVTLDNILDERRIELFCEGHRLFDLVRNNKTVTSYAATTRQPGDFDIICPIPQSETDINPELEQNPNY